MTSRLDRIIRQRLAKVDSLKENGIEPYPHRYGRSHTTQEAVSLLKEQEARGDEQSQEVSVAGRITANRQMGKISFLDLRDGWGKIQVYCHRGHLDESSLKLFKELDIGDFYGVKGKLLRTKKGEPSIDASQLTLLAKALNPLPEKWHGLQDIDTRFRKRYLDLISNPGVKATFATRSRIITAIRNYLNNRGFLEVETPVLQPQAGGALARPFITHYHSLDQNSYLRIALELHLKRLIIGGYDRVYEIGRVFRNEGLSTKHNPEFTMLESYTAYADYSDVMEMLEDMVSTIVKEITGGYEIKYGDNVINFKPPWPRINLRDIIKEKSGIDFNDFPDTKSLQAEMKRLDIEFDPSRDRGRLIDDLLSTFVEPGLIQPTFLIDYPIDMSPLAKTKPDDKDIVERFEAFACGMEIANAFSELNDPVEQRKRFLKQLKSRKKIIEDEEEIIDEDFLTALEYGMPPTGGLGVGIDRLVMLLTNRQSIREVILFPQLKEKE